MKHLKWLAAVASAAFFIASVQAQNAGTVTNHAFVIGKGAGVQGYGSVPCTSTQIPIGQTSADPTCQTVTGDVTINASGVTAIGATKVVSAMLGADVFSTAHSWGGQQTFTAPILGTPASGTLTNATGLPISSGVSGLAAGVATFLATPSSANLKAAITDETGSGAAVFATSPTLVTPALGAATGFSINLTGGSVTFSTSGQGLVGTGTNDNATSGVVGEYVESPIAVGSAVSLVNATAKNVTTISLTAGDWDVDVSCYYTATGAITAITCGINPTADNTLDTTVGRFGQLIFSLSAPATLWCTIPPYRLSLSGTTTIRMIAQANFSTGATSAYGLIRARRVR